MSENRCCGNCARFFNEDAKGNGFCSISPNRQVATCRHNICIAHEWKLPKWTEITPDNIDEIRKSKKKIAIMNPKEWDVPRMLYSIPADSLVLYSEWGGYYYYVLPELKI